MRQQGSWYIDYHSNTNHHDLTASSNCSKACLKSLIISSVSSSPHTYTNRRWQHVHRSPLLRREIAKDSRIRMNSQSLVVKKISRTSHQFQSIDKAIASFTFVSYARQSKRAFSALAYRKRSQSTHTARYTERGCDSSQYRSDGLDYEFPSVTGFHVVWFFGCWLFCWLVLNSQLSALSSHL